MKNRITAIIGAGVPLGFDSPNEKPSTSFITETVKKPYKDYHTQLPIKIVEEIYQRMKTQLPPDVNPWANTNEPYVHFEMLFHAMEMYLSYYHATHSKCSNPDIFPVFAPFIKQQPAYDIKDLYQIMPRFIRRIFDIIKSYDDYFANDGGREHWYRNFFLNTDFQWDFFNLNYDTTLEQTFGESKYEDGFQLISGKDYSEFVPQKLFLNSESLPTINHLHGCIRYYYNRDHNGVSNDYRFEDIFKYHDSNAVRDMMVGRSQSQQPNQTNEILYAGPIITGLRKTDKLNCIPYDFYHANLYKTLFNSHRLFVAGYSFGDLYVNQQIERMGLLHGNNKRVVIVDYWNHKEIDEFGLEKYLTYSISKKALQFLLIMCEETSVGNLINRLRFKDVNTPMYSDNGCVMLLVNGMKEATKFKNDIDAFLI